MNLPPPFRLKTTAIVTLYLAALYAPAAWGAWVWVEGEKPVKSSMNRHPWWYNHVTLRHGWASQPCHTAGVGVYVNLLHPAQTLAGFIV